MPLKRKCANRCGNQARFLSGLKAFCSMDCTVEFAKKAGKKATEKKEKVKRKEFKQRKDKLNETVPYWTKKAQSEFNKYIRQRDKERPCVSCGKYESDLNHSSRGGFWDCGHYRSVGSCPELRFEPLNAHKQCKKCNQFLSGNHVEYRFGIAKRLSASQLAWVEGPHEPKRYRVDELKELHAHFKGLNRFNA